ncbi:MAG: transposase [Syntrophobacterales bacterium]|nr:transposase [Syntrophobacterales bacterium]
MEKKEDMMNGSVSKDEEMEGARRATVISSSLAPHRSRGINVVPDPEVPEKATRRRFTVEYKLRILREAQDCREQHQLGAMLRREGLYHSNLATWRKQVEKGTIDALSSKKRGPKARRPDPSARRIAEQEKEILKLRSNLRKAELIIEAQKKMAELFQSYLDPKGGENS